jgi:flavin-dependent dehydrogenase
MTERCDALVIGGGPGGAATALLLARAGWSVVLVERKAFPRRKVCGEYLSATSLPLLEQLGVADAFRDTAGPEVRRVGLFARSTILHADLPRPRHRLGWGRALGREHLDTLLLRRAAEAGANVRQPCSLVALERLGDGYHGLLDSGTEVRTEVVIAAHGSWEPGPLPTQTPRRRPRPSDLLGFKAHFHGSALADDLMPLLVFPGGYGGMVHGDVGRVSLSCCVRRDCLFRLRRRYGGEASAAVFEHIRDSCLGVRQALDGATRDDAWLAAGPIRPGIRVPRGDGLFAVGNAAGEAHPVVAEGISMALQSAWLLARRLWLWKEQGHSPGSLIDVEAKYARAWRRSFGPRVYAAEGVAQWAMRPAVVAGTLPLLRCWPRLLTVGARLSGKATQVVRS